MGHNSYFADVQDEIHRMRRANKEQRIGVWVVLPVSFMLNAIALALVVWGTSWLFGDSVTFLLVGCTAYVCAVSGWSLYRLQQRVDQMALHLASIHDEVLMVQELIQEERRKSVKWRS